MERILYYIIGLVALSTAAYFLGRAFVKGGLDQFETHLKNKFKNKENGKEEK